MEALQRVKLDGYGVSIGELETELDYLRRAKRSLQEWLSTRTAKPGTPTTTISSRMFSLIITMPVLDVFWRLAGSVSGSDPEKIWELARRGEAWGTSEALY
jgi:hypothetical protein